MFYKEKNADVVKEGKWDEKSCIRRIGGYDIDKSNLPASMKYLPKGAVMAYNASNGKAILVKTAKVYETANTSSEAADIKVEKGNALNVGDVIGGNTVTAIVQGETFDTVKVNKVTKKLNVGDVISESGKTILGLNYATVALDDMPSCTPTLQAYEIEEDTLPYAINDDIKDALTVRHAFKI